MPCGQLCNVEENAPDRLGVICVCTGNSIWIGLDWTGQARTLGAIGAVDRVGCFAERCGKSRRARHAFQFQVDEPAISRWPYPRQEHHDELAQPRENKEFFLRKIKRPVNCAFVTAHIAILPLSEDARKEDVPRRRHLAVSSKQLAASS